MGVKGGVKHREQHYAKAEARNREVKAVWKGHTKNGLPDRQSPCKPWQAVKTVLRPQRPSGVLNRGMI